MLNKTYAIATIHNIYVSDDDICYLENAGTYSRIDILFQMGVVCLYISGGCFILILMITYYNHRKLKHDCPPSYESLELLRMPP